MDNQKIASELVKVAESLIAEREPKRYFTLTEDGQWLLIDQGMPANAYNSKSSESLRDIQKLADRFGFDIDQVWVAETGKFISIEKAKRL